MSHGRRGNLSIYRSIIIGGLVFFGIAGAGCGMADEPIEPVEDHSSGGSWTVEDEEEASTADRTESVTDQAETDDARGDDAATDENSTDQAALACQGGEVTPVAFEGHGRDPAMRLTMYVRDDCVVVGKIAASTPDGNFSLGLRGELDENGNVTLDGRNAQHSALVDGVTNAATADANVRANFQGLEIERQIGLERLE